MKTKLKTLVGAGAALAIVATMQLVPTNAAHAYNAALTGVAECQEDGSIEVTWTFTSDTNVSTVDITAPAAIKAAGVQTSTAGVPTSLSYTTSYPAGSVGATETVTVEYSFDNQTDRQTDTTVATIALPGSNCAPPPAGGEWCSPGYWRQPQHLDSWVATGISTSALYNTYFAAAPIADNPTLLQVLQNPQIYNRRGSGAFNNVGDLLSGAHPDVDFDGERVENCPLN